MVDTLGFVMLEDVTITQDAVNQHTCDSKMSVEVVVYQNAAREKTPDRFLLNLSPLAQSFAVPYESA